MIKKRLIPLMLYRHGRLQKSVRFAEHRDVGDPVKTAQIFSDQDADELAILNIDADTDNFDRYLRSIRTISQTVFVPLVVGGGIRELRHAQACFDAGADKILLNSAYYESEELVHSICSSFGNQAVVCGIDMITNDQGKNYVQKPGLPRIHSGKAITLNDHLSKVLDIGAGEIFLQFRDLEGTMTGLNYSAIAEARPKVDLPLVVSGGVGNSAHIVDAFECGVDAVACGSIFYLSDNSPLKLKSRLCNSEIPLKKIK